MVSFISNFKTFQKALNYIKEKFREANSNKDLTIYHMNLCFSESNKKVESQLLEIERLEQQLSYDKNNAAINIKYRNMNVEELTIQNEQINTRISQELNEITEELFEISSIIEGIESYEKYINSYENLLLMSTHKYSINDILSFLPNLDQVYIRACQNLSHSKFLFDLLVDTEKNIANNNAISFKQIELSIEINKQPWYKSEEENFIKNISSITEELILLNSCSATMQEIIQHINLLDKDVINLYNSIESSGINTAMDHIGLIESIDFRLNGAQLAHIRFRQDYGDNKIDKMYINALQILQKNIETLANSTKPYQNFHVDEFSNTKIPLSKLSNLGKIYLLNEKINIERRFANHYEKIHCGIITLDQNINKLNEAYSYLSIDLKKGEKSTQESYQEMESYTDYETRLELEYNNFTHSYQPVSKSVHIDLLRR